MKKRYLLHIIIASVFFTFFIVFSILVKNDVFNSIDKNVVDFVVSFRGEKYGAIYWIFRILTELGFVYFMIFIFLLFFIFTKINLKSLILSFGTLTTYLSNFIVKIIIKRPRPLEEFRWMSEKSYSYPSSHTMCSTFMYGFLVYIIYKSNLKNKYKYPLMCLMIMTIFVIGISRIILSVHFFSDVLGGAILGVVFINLAIILDDYLSTRGIDGFKNLISKKK